MKIIGIKKNRTICSKNKDFLCNNLDHLSESAFNLCGSINEAIEKGEKMRSNEEYCKL